MMIFDELGKKEEGGVRLERGRREKSEILEREMRNEMEGMLLNDHI